MATKLLPAQDVLNQLLSYNPETGKLFWKERPVEMFSDGKQSAARNAAIWNGKHAGKEAFTATSRGYKVGRIGDHGFFAHRVIWKMVYGTEPDRIDHEGGSRDNNRLSKLMDVTEKMNGMNKSIPSNNTSGIIGVYRDNRRGWRAAIQVDGRQKHLGSFASIEEAAKARKLAEIRYGYHANHGRHEPLT
jgi:hypothetical protein